MSESSEFSKNTVDTLAKRAGQVCSNPSCEVTTSGGHTEPEKSVTVGEAAHIYGQMPGSKRYRPEMTSEERRDISNGIWLCRICHKLIDTDEQRFPARLLFEWKRQRENSPIGQKLEGKATKNIPVLTLQDSIRSTGSSHGHFQTFTIINMSQSETAFDCRYWLKGFGFKWEDGHEPFTLQEKGTRDILYPLPTYPEHSAPVIPDLQFIMIYKNYEGKVFRTVRLLKQIPVKTGVLHTLKPAEFLPPEQIKLPSCTVAFKEFSTYLGGIRKALFEVKDGDNSSIVQIGISNTFLSTWGVNAEIEEEIFIDLGTRKIEQMCIDGNLADYSFISDNFPQDYQLGSMGYKKLYTSI